MRFLILLSIIPFIACSPKQTKNSYYQEHNNITGTTYFTWKDANRVDAYYGGERIVNVQIWYPTNNLMEKGNYKPAKYYYGDQNIWEQLGGWSKEDIQFVSDIKTKSLIDAPISKENQQYPLIVFSPSLGGNLSFYNHYAEYLARHGYVVMGINHLYESEFVLDENKEIISQKLTFHDSLKSLKIPSEISADEYRKVKGQRSVILGEDLIFSIKMLSKVKGKTWSNKIDFDNIGIWGHSFGGAAAIQAALLDKRIRAVLNIDGTPPTLVPSQKLNIPYMFIEDLPNYESHEGLKKQYIRRDQFCKNVNNKAFRVLMGGVSHNSFLDINYHSAADESEKENIIQVLNKTASYMLIFFNDTLKGKAIKLNNLKSDSLEIKIFD